MCSYWSYRSLASKVVCVYSPRSNCSFLLMLGQLQSCPKWIQRPCCTPQCCAGVLTSVNQCVHTACSTAWPWFDSRFKHKNSAQILTFTAWTGNFKISQQNFPVMWLCNRFRSHIVSISTFSGTKNPLSCPDVSVLSERRGLPPQLKTQQKQGGSQQHWPLCCGSAGAM